MRFQSPKSGKFESNGIRHLKVLVKLEKLFQSPKSGKFESNTLLGMESLDVLS